MGRRRNCRRPHFCGSKPETALARAPHCRPLFAPRRRRASFGLFLNADNASAPAPLRIGPRKRFRAFPALRGAVFGRRPARDRSSSAPGPAAPSCAGHWVCRPEAAHGPRPPPWNTLRGRSKRLTVALAGGPVIALRFSMFQAHRIPETERWNLAAASGGPKRVRGVAAGGLEPPDRPGRLVDRD